MPSGNLTELWIFTLKTVIFYSYVRLPEGRSSHDPEWRIFPAAVVSTLQHPEVQMKSLIPGLVPLAPGETKSTFKY